MSVEPTALERSALEKKDRQELFTIAEALGSKPGSRARKAQIIDLILELTGVSSGSDTGTDGGASDDEAAAGETAAGEPERAEPGPDATDDAAAEPSAGGTDEPSVGQATSSGGSRGDRAPGRTEEDRSQPVRSGRPAQQGQRQQGQTPQGRSQTGDGRPPGQSQQGQQGRTQSGDGQQQGRGQSGDGQQQGQAQQGQAQQGQGQQGQGGEQQGDGDGESGNRRRRRRGRNRERGEQGAQEEFNGEPVPVEGLLDLREEGYGFLRLNGYLPSKDDVYVSVKQVRQFGLRRGDHVAGASRPALRNEKNPALLRIDRVNGDQPDSARERRRFEDLTPLFPDEKLRLELEDDPGNMTARIIDLIAPIGKGQRGLIVSPPKAGKTTIMKQIVRSIETNDPEVVLFVLLVDERPEEVTDMRRWLRNERSTVVASTFDRPAEEHTLVAELAIERAKRLVEDAKDVVIVLDGITRLSRAYNLAAPPTGRIMSGGIDTGALYPPKKFFGAARNVEEGGSLTILATALVETGSRMDEVIFEEFKGTGNMELRLDRRLAERRIYPAIDVNASSTRHEELLFHRNQLSQVWKLRRVLNGLGGGEGGDRSGAGLELLIDRMRTFKSNDQFLTEVAKGGTG